MKNENSMVMVFADAEVLNAPPSLTRGTSKYTYIFLPSRRHEEVSNSGLVAFR